MFRTKRSLKSIERGSGQGYDEACSALVDISEAYSLYETVNQFQNELKEFMTGYTRRKALIQRLVLRSAQQTRKNIIPAPGTAASTDIHTAIPLFATASTDAFFP